ncbi:hypothetical protein EJM73_09510 [Clostridium botulinum]|uniref:hypothetical protein n=1 Tax=Clostridium botulinum TaxID=1491 RepID=UPI001375DF6D|nr:hypothetical protein [Clostridium botulinum]NCI19862.1 hypothetical protein [Clostridium botulinum]NCI35900.1 hypothetical protein [Clostridium botulinum]NCI71757.1 hypothetical protein [Clostridium botulinum]NDI38673.1 hypothetical protein [Clostridium botulinum]
MGIKIWTCHERTYKSIQVKWDKLNTGGENMENVISLETYSNNKNTQIESYSILDMILDSNKREEVYEYYDSNYKETSEEKQIFEAWKKRRSRRNK